MMIATERAAAGGGPVRVGVVLVRVLKGRLDLDGALLDGRPLIGEELPIDHLEA
jgi:hypothetical protein